MNKTNRLFWFGLVWFMGGLLPLAAPHAFAFTRLDTNTPSSTGVNIAICGDHVYAVWMQNNFDTVRFNRSTDQGRTWQSEETMISAAARWLTSLEIACNESGYVNVVWDDARSNPRTLYISRSSDFGQTWSSERALTSDANANGYPSWLTMRPDAAGNFFLGWVKSDYTQILFLRSHDNGLTWLGPQRIDVGQSSTVFDLSIATNGSGKVYAVWMEASGISLNDGKNRVFFKYSHDAGDTWNGTPTGNAYVLSSVRSVKTYAEIAAADDNVYVLWGDSRNNPDQGICSQRTPAPCAGDLLMRYSNDGGVTWLPSSGERQVNAVPLAGSRVIISAQGNRFYVYDRGFRYSPDGGNTLLPAEGLDLGWNTPPYRSGGLEFYSNRSGQVAAVWLDWRCTDYNNRANCPAENILELFSYNYSMDQGQTWEASKADVFDFEIPYSWNEQAAFDENGNLFFLWKMNSHLYVATRKIPPEPERPWIKRFQVRDVSTQNTDTAVSRTVAVELAASDPDGLVAEYLITETSVPPAPGGFRLSQPPAYYGITGSDKSWIHLYAWALDDEGNVSEISPDSQDTIFLNLPVIVDEIRLDSDPIPGRFRTGQTRLAAGSDGANQYVYAVLSDPRDPAGDPNIRDIYIRRSVNNGLSWEDARRINDDALGFSRAAADACTAGNGRYLYLLWSDSRDGTSRNYFNYSADFGGTWLSEDMPVTMLPSTGGHLNRLACDDSGNVYAVGVSKEFYDLTTVQHHNDLFFNALHLFDPQPQWNSADVIIDHDGGWPTWVFAPQIAADDAGHVYVVWQEFRRPGGAIWFNYSEDGGSTWRHPNDKMILSAGQNPLLAASKTGGHVYAADLSSGGTAPNFTSSSDHGETWSTPRPLYVGTYLQGLTASETGDRVYAVGHDYKNVYLNYSRDFGSAWLSSANVVKVNKGTNGSWPSMWVDFHSTDPNQDRVYVVWWDNRNGWKWDIYFNYSLDGGVTFQQADIRIDSDLPGTAISQYPLVVGDGAGRAHITWKDERSGEPDVYYDFVNVLGGGAPIPRITEAFHMSEIDPGSVPYGDMAPRKGKIHIRGQNFGGGSASAYVEFNNGVQLDSSGVISWSDTEIVTKVPSSSAPGLKALFVATDPATGLRSNDKVMDVFSFGDLDRDTFVDLDDWRRTAQVKLGLIPPLATIREHIAADVDENVGVLLTRDWILILRRTLGMQGDFPVELGSSGGFEALRVELPSSPVTFTVGTASDFTGSTVGVPITVSDLGFRSVEAVDLAIQYNSSLVKPVNTAAGSRLPSGWIVSPRQGGTIPMPALPPNPLRVSLSIVNPAATVPLTGSGGEVLIVSFQILGGVLGTSPLHVSEAAIGQAGSGSELALALDGAITVREHLGAPVIRNPAVFPGWFSPDGNGFADETHVLANLSKTADWTVQILDGFEVIASGSGMGQTSVDFLWNGISQITGEPVGNGFYEWTIQAVSGPDAAEPASGGLGVDLVIDLAEIAEPAHLQDVYGSAVIKGQVFDIRISLAPTWSLLWGAGMNPAEWNSITTGYGGAQLNDSFGNPPTLGVWNGSSQMPGLYTIKLHVFDQAGNYSDVRRQVNLLDARGDYDLDGDVDYVDFVNFRQCALPGCDFNGDTFPGDSADEAIFWQRYDSTGGPDNQPLVLQGFTPAPDAVTSSGYVWNLLDTDDLYVRMNAVDPNGFAVKYEIVCSQDSGSLGGGCLAANPNPYGIWPEDGIIELEMDGSREGFVGRIYLRVKATEDIWNVFETDDPRVRLTSVESALNFEFMAYSRPVFVEPNPAVETAVTIGGRNIIKGQRNQIDVFDGGMMRIKVEDQVTPEGRIRYPDGAPRAMDRVTIFFKGFGSRPRKEWTCTAYEYGGSTGSPDYCGPFYYEGAAGTWVYEMHDDKFPAKDYEVYVTAFNEGQVSSKYPAFGVYLTDK